MSTAIPQVKLNAKTDEKKALSFAAASISRTGLLLNNDEILDAICKEKDPHFRAGVKDKKRKKEKDTLISDSGFIELENQLKETLRDIAREMKSGSAVTCVAKGESKSCKYCKMKQLCRAGSPVQVEEDDEEQNN